MEAALESLRRGEFVLLYDSDGRENEVDMVIPAGAVMPEHVASMRMQGGGLICVAVENGLASSIGLRYMHQMLAGAVPDSSMILGTAPYGDHPTFSLSVNHAGAFTGVTDTERSATIRGMARLHGLSDPKAEFVSSFRAPGHVPLLIASEGLLAERRGHTEMSVYLAKAAGLPPVVAICEMMDGQTYGALSLAKAEGFARQHGLAVICGKDLPECAQVT